MGLRHRVDTLWNAVAGLNSDCMDNLQLSVRGSIGKLVKAVA